MHGVVGVGKQTHAMGSLGPDMLKNPRRSARKEELINGLKKLVEIFLWS